MKISLKLVLLLASPLSFTPLALPQNRTAITTRPHRKATKKASVPSLETQIQQMRQDLQSQIDELKSRLAARDAQIEAMSTGTQSTQEKVATTAARVEAIDNSVHDNATTMSGLQSTVSTLRTESSSNAITVKEVQTTQVEIQKSIDEPASIHYKGVTLTPGGFLAGETIWRQRAMNADIYTNFNATPYMNSGEARTSEFLPTARQSRLSLLVSGKAPFGTIRGYFEGDFLSAGITSNNLQSNSYTLRTRQAWGQAAFGDFKFTGGQMWTLMTENRKSTNPGEEAIPIFFDGNLHVGFTYVRQTGFRFQDSITPKMTVAVALENSQYQFAATNAPTNFFFGNAGSLAGLENSAANYTNQVAPDVIAKVAFDPGYGHYEIGGIARFFRDRYYPAITTEAGAQNDTKLGGGFVASARFPVTKKADLGLHLVAGTGTGRYGASLLPDITVHPNGTLAPIRNSQTLLSFEVRPKKNLDLFSYFGTEYAQRTYYRNPTTGELVGYAPPTASNAGCNTEAVPTAGTGFAPGTGICLGATRAIIQGSVGWVYRFYNGPAGKLQYGVAYSYLTREGWTGIGGSPKATNNMVYTSFRYYIP
ncbi:hypothetical protein [Granulicella sp. dw_53]|uniref:hypothetical protein n=1 Tax=Granulicella sp. dw_53 TaxID=2719792 RepID=UPI001BD5A9BE|nr:hypothetical protein [Granulicella sp. dw_53]